MNFGEIKAYVRQYAQALFALNKKSEGGQFDLTDGLLETFINEGYLLFASLARTVKEKKYIATTANTTRYNLSDALALQTTKASNNLVQIVGVQYEAGTDKWKLRAVQDAEQLFWETLSNDSPQAYDLQYGNKEIIVYPKVTNTGENIWIYGVWLPVPLSDDADEPQIPNNYHQALCDYANFRVQMLIGSLDQTKTTAQMQFERFKGGFYELANECRKEVESRDNVRFQMREDDEDDQFWDNFYYPTFNHSPVISLVYLKDVLQFKDITTGIIRLEINSSGILVNGSSLAFLGVRGKDNFASYTGSTVVTIADQGSTDYNVQITPILTGAPSGTIGEYGYVINSATQFTVYNSGESTGEFSYLVTKS